MKAYLQAFVNIEQNNRAKLLLIVEFIYNNANNTSIGYMLFELNRGYYSYIPYKKDIDAQSKLNLVDDFLLEL